MDRNGNRETKPDAFEFTVVLPWYRQAGFLALAFAGTMLMAILVAAVISNYRQRGALIAQLTDARMAAEAASRHKSEFLANMSHEIRTPMNAILGMTQLSLETSLNDEQKEYLQSVQTAADSLLVLLNDVLDFSKIEAGKLEIVPVDFNLQDCVNDVLRTLALRARQSGLELSPRFDRRAPPFLLGDSQRLRQVLLNLVGNAIKFTPAGEVRVVVEIESQDAAAICMHFIVADTGVGVPQDKQKMIFDPFEQADASTTRRFGGTGLGLAISAKLVRLMEGNLWLESPWHDPDTGGLVTGSAFHFTARLRPGKPPVETTPESSAPAANRRVLVVEDNEVNLKIMVRMLEKRGHTVLVARNGHEALELWRRQPVDAVLMDVQMPEMDGFEATRWIREEERTRGGHVHIVALTAHALKGDSDRCLSAGMDDYLTKPIRWADLDRALASLGPAVHSTVISNP